MYAVLTSSCHHRAEDFHTDMYLCVLRVYYVSIAVEACCSRTNLPYIRYVTAEDQYSQYCTLGTCAGISLDQVAFDSSSRPQTGGSSRSCAAQRMKQLRKKRPDYTLILRATTELRKLY